MRKTLTLILSSEAVDFIHKQEGATDPSALINQLFHAEMDRLGYKSYKSGEASQNSKNDNIAGQLEDLMDESTSAGE